MAVLAFAVAASYVAVVVYSLAVCRTVAADADADAAAPHCIHPIKVRFCASL